MQSAEHVQSRAADVVLVEHLQQFFRGVRWKLAREEMEMRPEMPQVRIGDAPRAVARVKMLYPVETAVRKVGGGDGLFLVSTQVSATEGPSVTSIAPKLASPQR